jgi:hypothetical protein
MLYEGKIVKSSLTDKQKNPKSKKGVKSIKLKTDDTIKQVKVEKKGEVVEKKKAVKKKVDKPKKAVKKKTVLKKSVAKELDEQIGKKKTVWKPDPKVWNKINMKLRETGTNIRDLRHEIVLNETANKIRGYANDRAFLKAVEKFKPVPKKDRKKEIEDILDETSIKEIYHAILKVRRDRGEFEGIVFRGTRDYMKELLMEGKWKIYLNDVIDILTGKKKNNKDEITEKFGKLSKEKIVDTACDVLTKHGLPPSPYARTRLKKLSKQEILVGIETVERFKPYKDEIYAELRKLK